MKESPYFNINYGWPYGADGWNIGMDENLLVLSFLNTHSVIDIVDAVPDNPLEGDSYVVSTDNSARFFADGTWQMFYPSDGWEFTTVVGGTTWVFEGGVPVPRANPDDLSQKVEALQNRADNVDSQLEDINSSLAPLEELPQRVTELENDSASAADVQALTERVEDVETESQNHGQRIDSAEVRMGSLEDSVSQISGDVDTKLESVVAGEGIEVDNTDPLNPVLILDTSALSAVAVSGDYNDLAGTPTLGTAAEASADDFDPAGSASGVQDALTLIMDERMPSTARAAVNALDPSTATLEDLITALQS